MTLDCSEMRVLEAELTLALRQYSQALKASRRRGFRHGDADTEAAAERVTQAWAALVEHDAGHGCGPAEKHLAQAG